MDLQLKNHKKRLIFVLFYALIDLCVCTLLFIHANYPVSHFTLEVSLFKISTSMFEFWIFGLFRTAVTLGALLGVLWNPSDGVRRMNKISYLILSLSAIMWAYPIVKMLMHLEVNEDLRNPWFWSFFSWSLTSAFVFYGTWEALVLLHKDDKKMDKVCKKSKSNSTNSVESDQEPLVPSNSDSGDDEDITSKSKTMGTVCRLLSYSKPDLPFLLGAFIFTVASSMAEIFTPWFTGEVIQGIAMEKSYHKFVHAIIILSVLSLGCAISSGLRGGFFRVAIVRLNIRLSNLLFASVLHQEVGFFDTTKTGDITSRLSSDTTKMADILCLNLNVFLRSLIKAIGVVVFMMKLSWRMSILTLIGLPIIMGVSKLYGAYIEELSTKIQVTLAKANEVAEEVVSSMRTVRSFANEGEETQRYADRLQDTFKLKIRESFVFAGYMWCTKLFSLSLVIATLYYGGHLVVKDMMTAGNLVSFILYQMELGYALESISWVFSGLMEAVGASERVFELIDRQPEIQNTGTLAPDTLDGHLEFRDVVFAYPSRPETNVLKGVSFKVGAGEVVALVGPSGGGKSSCVNLLEHFYETQSGQVLLDGTDIKLYDHQYLHSKISLVGQEPVLYARSVKDNIAYGRPDIDMSHIIEAAKLANAHDFIMELRDGYDTETGEKGMQLSGGQKQRVAIARAVVRHPAVLVLDEATSALDSESEHVVQKAMYKKQHGYSVLIIAHRLSTVEHADRIVYIHKGRVVEQGSHQELLGKGGMYARLVQRQLLGMEAGLGDDMSKNESALGLSKNKGKPNGNKSKTPESYEILQGSYHSLKEEDAGIAVRGRCPLPQVDPPFGTPGFTVGSADSNC